MMLTDGVMPVRIREDVIVCIARLPHDLTKEEANKIAKVILAYVNQSNDGVTK